MTYYYKVIAIDGVGFSSIDSNIAAASAVSDSIPPEVISMEPGAWTLFGSVSNITVTASDNLALSSITLSYSVDGTTWIAIATNATRDTTTFKWDSSTLNGDIQVRAVARDSLGNESVPLIKTYKFDNEAQAFRCC